jgi:UDP-N-acetylmuramoyl-L-alanyl-D-glutamate--2,6-diaminopimelate ligase
VNGTLEIEPDRRAAIAIAIDRAAPGDIVMLLERGSRAGGLFDRNDVPQAFDDREIARELLEALAS